MAWRIEFKPDAEKAFSKLDHQTQRRIRHYLREKVAPLENPRVRGEAMKANFAGLWRYRVGDYRIVCQIINETITILVVKIGHRREVYD